MVQKIQTNEYLKRIGNMSFAEREEYVKRVGEWLRDQAWLLNPRMKDETAKFQNVLQSSIIWNDAESNAWMTGVRLLTALVAVSDTWLPDLLFTKSAKRSIRRLIDCLKEATEMQRGDNVAVAQQHAGRETGKAMPGVKVAVAQQHAGRETEKAMPGVKVAAAQQHAGREAVEALPSGGVAVPVRPKHIDQYVHLLPKKTQERAAQVRGLLRDLDVARENMRLLMNDTNANDASRAQWAKTATSIDERVKGIYRELDKEWGKLVKDGRVTVDDLGNAYVKSTESAEKTEDTEAPSDSPGGGGRRGRPALTEEEKAAKAAERQEKKIADNLRKAALLRKSLIDKRNAKTEAHKEKWIAKYKEMVKLGGDDAVTDKVREAAEYYGVALNKNKKE